MEFISFGWDFFFVSFSTSDMMMLSLVYILHLVRCGDTCVRYHISIYFYIPSFLLSSRSMPGGSRYSFLV